MLSLILPMTWSKASCILYMFCALFFLAGAFCAWMSVAFPQSQIAIESVKFTKELM